jgi:hypothetical protein
MHDDVGICIPTYARLTVRAMPFGTARLQAHLPAHATAYEVHMDIFDTRNSRSHGLYMAVIRAHRQTPA